MTAKCTFNNGVSDGSRLTSLNSALNGRGHGFVDGVKLTVKLTVNGRVHCFAYTANVCCLQ